MASVGIYKDGKLVCRGAGDSHLPRSLRTRSPHALFLFGGGSTAKGRAPRGARAAARMRLAAGDFVRRTTRLRGWTAAILRVLHDTSFRNGNGLLPKYAGKIFQADFLQKPDRLPMHAGDASAGISARTGSF